MKQYLTFFIHDEEYAVEILRVREIIEYERVTAVPTVPPHIRGVINLRGALLPVVDLAVRFGQQPTALTRTCSIVVVEAQLDGDCVTVGLMVSAVSAVIDIDAAQIEPPPPFGTNVRVHFLTGLGKVDGRLLLMLDVDRSLATIELLPIHLNSETEGNEHASTDDYR